MRYAIAVEADSHWKIIVRVRSLSLANLLVDFFDSIGIVAIIVET